MTSAARPILFLKAHIEGYVKKDGTAVRAHEDSRPSARKVQVDGKWRHSEDTHGRPLHPKFNGQLNFWRWFGDSKVVDADGKPLVCAHFTEAEFDAFNQAARDQHARDEAGFTTSYGSSFVFPRKGFFFFAGDVPHRKEAIGMPVYVKIENPLDFRRGLTPEESGKVIDFLKSKIDQPASPGTAASKLRGDVIGGFRKARKEGMTGQQLWDLANVSAYTSRARQFDDILDLLGKDGTIFESNSSGTINLERNRGAGDGKTYLTVVPREPSQIKSSIGNSGDFNPAEPSIVKAMSIPEGARWITVARPRI